MPCVQQDGYERMLTIARLTLVDAINNRLFLLALAAVIGLFMLAVFIGELAITETRQVQAVILASALRLFAVMLISLFVITSMVREFNDKGVEILLALPLPRYAYYFGKLSGYALSSLLLAVLVSVPLLFFAEVGAVALWCFSLCCELLLVIALSLLGLFTCTHIIPAYTGVLAFYLLARSLEAIQLLSTSPVLESNAWPQEFMYGMIAMIALVLPDLGRFTNSSWLAYEIQPAVLLPVLLQTLIYLCILVSAGLFDLYRKNL